MTQQRAKRNHFVPQFLIKNWADDFGKVWVLNKQDKKIFQTSPSRVLLKNDLYTTYEGPEFEPSDEFERLFAEFEYLIAPIVKKIIADARENRPKSLQPKDFRLCKAFLVLQTWRTPESQARIFDRDHRTFSTNETEQLNLENYGLDELNIESNASIHKDAKYYEKSNLLARFAAGELPGQTSKFREYEKNHGLDCWVIRNPRRSVLHGSHGCCFFEKQYKGKKYISPPLIPIAPDIVLTFSEHPNKFRRLGEKDFVAEDKWVRRFNSAMFKYSNQVIARDEKLLEKYKPY